MDLTQTTFPVYEIRKHNYIQQDGNLTYVVDGSGKHILDNKNLSGTTLGLRRLKITDQENLYKLGKTFFTVLELIKFKKYNSTFVDSRGKTFSYLKRKYVKVRYYEIIGHTEVEAEGNVIFLRKLNQPFLISKSYTNLIGKWAGVLNLQGGQVIYEIIDKCEPEKVIMI